MSQQSKCLFTAFGMSDKGRVRQGNEDAFFCNAEEGIFVVCDGMGGAAAGEIASGLAAKHAADALAGGDLDEARMYAAVTAANRAVFQKAMDDRRLEGMGTTLVTLALNGHGAWLAHVGDSRCYVLREGRLERLTMDHSLVEEQVRLGQITRAQAERSPFQHVITRAVGTTAEVTPDVRHIDVRAGDLFLLASDGLTRELSDEAIAETLRRAVDEREASEALLRDANAAGGRDNITCLLVRIHS